MNSFFRKIAAVFTIIATALTNFFGGGYGPIIPPDDKYPITQAKEVAASDLIWPKNQMFPTFSAPEGELVAFPMDLFSDTELTALACLQGFANAIETRVIILDSDVEKWLGDYGFSYNRVNGDNAYDYIKDLCTDSVSGVVIYSDELSDQYSNLASSIGNISNAIPLTGETYDKWVSEGIELPVVADIRGLEYTTAYDIYKYFFDNYWEESNHKVLVVQRPDMRIQMRDLASAIGGAVVYLSCAGGKETRLFKKYLSTMTPGKSILTGWYAGQERELMTVAAQCGLSCVPSDFFSNPTVFAQKQSIKVPTVPNMSDLDNKIYVAYFLSDGDNIQYDMHAMRLFWDENADNQGQVPINWTISPALVDIAPGMMNYYYTRATDAECFVCGPSGMGYTMPKNTFGTNKGNQFRCAESFKAFVGLTNNYMQRAGLRTVTIWDNLSLAHRRIYSNLGSYLYGLTVQHFTNSSLKARFTGVTKDMLFIQQTPGYFAQNAEGNLPLSVIGGHVKDAVKFLKYNGSEPVFVATQASVWAFHNVADVVALEKELSDYYAETYGEDVVEFVRADHFFNLYYQANDLPQDVTLKSSLTATATSNNDIAELTADGSCYVDNIWQAAESGQESITYALGDTYKVSEISLYHAETANLDSSLNTGAFTVEISTDSVNWQKVAEVSGNTDSWNNVKFKAAKAEFVRITITKPGADGIARVADIDIWGTLV